MTRRPGAPDPEPVRASHDRLLFARDEAKRHVRRIVAVLDDKEHGFLCLGSAGDS